MKNKNIEIYNRNKNSRLITPNPLTTETNLAAGLDYPLVDSVFIKTGLGPNGTFNTMVDDIDKGLRTTEIKSGQAYMMEQLDRCPYFQRNKKRQYGHQQRTLY